MSKTEILITIIVIAVIGIGAYFVLTSLKPSVPSGVPEETGEDYETTTYETSSEESTPETSLPEGSIELTVNIEDGFNPKTFTVKTGETIKVELTCTDTVGHVMQFKNPEIELVLVGGPKGSGEETDTTIYTVPTSISPGEYEFYDVLAEINNLPSLTGKMIVE